MSKRIFIVLLLFTFVAELAVMKLFTPLLSQLSALPAALLDASILSLLLAPPYWMLCQCLPLRGSRDPKGAFLKADQTSLFFQLIMSVFAIEFLVMLLLATFYPDLTWSRLTLLDASLTILLVLPFIWRALSRVDSQFDKSQLTDLFGSPIILCSTLLYAVFLADVFQELVQPYLTPNILNNYFILLDSTLTTLLTAPFLWLLVGRPLMRAAHAESTRSRTILDQVIDAIVTLDAKGQILLMNPAAQNTFDFTQEELAGRSAEILFTENQLNIQQLISEVPSGRSGRQELMLREKLCRNRSGKTLTMNISLSSIQQYGQQQWLLILHDISHLKETEKAMSDRDERFKQIFDQSDDAIAFFKPNSIWIIDVNTTFAELFGYSKERIKKQGLEQLLRPVDFSRISSAIMETGPKTSTTMDDCIGLRHNGTQFNLSMRSKLMTIDSVSIVSCSFRDITNRLLLEKEAKDIQAKLIQANKMTSLGLMVSGVAHEINNPNNFIITNSRLLASTWKDNRKILLEYFQEHGDFCLGDIPFSELDKHAPKLFAGILEGSDRINGIVNNLKNFYRSGRTTESCMNINQIATSAASLLQHELVNFTKHFRLSLAEELPTVTGNAQQIAQVVINLLMNACQALTSKDQAIILETSYDEETSQVTLTIRDEGRGMTQGDSRRVMEPFFTTKLDEGGTGLGLTICKSIIMEHQGTLEFTSKSGKGTTFVVKLPADIPTAKD